LYFRLTLLFTCLGVLAAFAASCNGPIYHHRRSYSPAAAVPDRQKWRITGDLRDPQKAADGNISTAALSQRNYDSAYITIDLGKVSMFNMVIVDHGNEEFGFCRRLAVDTSLDGKSFTFQYAAPGTRRVTLLVLPKPVLARYVRLRTIVPGVRRLSVAEVYLR